ncbi:MAG: restriction endonuclease subunit S [Dialister sp.]|nr:restriction endonuclease subunit S [Dialister sp.]
MSKNIIAPPVRFQGFTAPWRQRKFADLATVRRGLTYKPHNVIEGGKRVLRSSNINENTFQVHNDDVFVDENVVNIPCVNNGDILITSANGSSRLIGKHAIIRGIPENSAVHGGFMLLASSDESEFVNALMSSLWYTKFINAYVAGGNGAIGNLNKNDLEEQIAYVPQKEEMHKIGDFFGNLDHLITLHQHKLELQKKLKAFFLKNMFPEEGETVPRIRFKEFAGDWEQRKIADVAEIITGGTPSTRIVEYWNPPEVPWLSSGEVHKKYITSTDTMISRKGYENSSATMVRENSVLIALAGQGKTRGTVAINRIPLATNQSIAAMTFSDDIDPDYVFSNLENRYEELRRISSGDGSRGGLNKKLVGDVTIPCPTLLEQNAIGTLFRVLNELITLHQRKIDQLQAMKKFMLQNLFV